MIKVIRSFTALFFLLISIYTIGSPLQQSPEVFAKGPSNNTTSVNTSSSSLIKEIPVNIVTDTVTTIVRDTSFMQINTRLKVAATRLMEKTAKLEEYVKANGFNTDYCFMIDMSIPSGKNRFFVYNIKKGSVELSSLVSHGAGSYKKGCNDVLTFSNVPESRATSLGKYKIGNSYWGTYGLSYKLFGLDSTNCNAYERAIVLHSDSYVPEKEIYPYPLYQSSGCPIVSPSFLSTLGKYIKTSSKPILLWVYN